MKLAIVQKAPKRISDYAMVRGKQRGATLIMVLVILVAMTFLGLSSMSDSNIQLAMVRNSQLKSLAFSAAQTESNAQIDLLNTNAPNELDLALVALVQSPRGDVNGDGIQDQQIIGGGDPALILQAPLVLGAAVANSLEQTFTLTRPNVNLEPPVDGYSIDSDVRFIYLEFDSVVTIDGTATSSDQTQGFRYIAPSAN